MLVSNGILLAFITLSCDYIYDDSSKTNKASKEVLKSYYSIDRYNEYSESNKDFDNGCMLMIIADLRPKDKGLTQNLIRSERYDYYDTKGVSPDNCDMYF